MKATTKDPAKNPAKTPAVVALVYFAVLLIAMEYMFLPPRFEAMWEGFGIGEWTTPTLTGGLG